MNTRKTSIISMTIFIILVVFAIPLHMDSMNQIIQRQEGQKGIKGFILEEKNDARFKPRQYIQIEFPQQVEPLDQEKNE